MDFGSFLRARRLELGLTLAATAQRAGVDARVLQYVEVCRTARLPKPAVLEALARALQVAPDDLIRAAGYTTRIEPPLATRPFAG
jgi:transcriptional regulator with XRE-family HTH domain